jgi:ArsR family transcriptional regulator
MKVSNYSKIFKALSNEQRLNIFLMIYKQCCVPKGSGGSSEFKTKGGSCCPVRGIQAVFTKICGCMNLSKSTISHHLKELQNAGLIICEREGQTYRCRVNKKTLNSIKEFLK